MYNQKVPKKKAKLIKIKVLRRKKGHDIILVRYTKRWKFGLNARNQIKSVRLFSFYAVFPLNWLPRQH